MVWTPRSGSVNVARSPEPTCSPWKNFCKDLPDMMHSDGVKSIYWAGTESGLMDIYNFSGVISATNGSRSSKGISAGFY